MAVCRTSSIRFIIPFGTLGHGCNTRKVEDMKPKRREWLDHDSETERKEGKILAASQSGRDGCKMPALMPPVAAEAAT